MQHALAELFGTGPDRDHQVEGPLQEIESATDRCEDVANVLDTIVLKMPDLALATWA